MKKNWIEKLKKQYACRDGLAWASEYDSAQAAWSACERADWMLWACGMNCGKIGSESHRNLILACVECAKTSLKYIKDKEVKRLVKKSLDTTERWAKGEDGITLKDVEESASAAWSAANAANAAAGAAWAAWAAGYAADAAAAAGAAAAAAAADAAGYDAAGVREKALKECADIIRTIQPNCPKFKREKV